MTQASLRSQIAIVQQEPILFHRSLAENIAYARPGATRSEIIEAAKLASAHDFIDGAAQGLRDAGGRARREALGRRAPARRHRPRLPRRRADPDPRRGDLARSIPSREVLIQQAMERLMVGRTTIVIAHRLSTVRALDRLLVFDKGRIVEEGTHEQLVQRDGGIYRRLFERQALELTKGLQRRLSAQASERQRVRALSRPLRRAPPAIFVGDAGIVGRARTGAKISAMAFFLRLRLTPRSPQQHVEILMEVVATW